MIGHLRRRLAVRTRFLAMGTLVTVTVITAPGREPGARAALAQVERELQYFGRDGWAWGDGELARFNRALARGERASVPASLQALFAHAWQIRQATAGRFEPRIATLVHLWGFDDPERLRDSPPPQAEIDVALQALRAAPDYDGGEHYGPARGIGWDLGGIGKGYIVDRMLDRLELAGYRDASIDAGGNLAVRGRYRYRRWHTGIRDPRSTDPHAPQLLAELEVENEAVITHGDDQRGFEYQQRRYGHLLDPATGWPAQGLCALTVVHPDAAYADAAGGALYVAGPQRWPSLARQLGIHQVLALDREGELTATPRLAARLRLSAGLRLRLCA